MAAHKTSQARDNNDNEKKNDVHDQGTKEAAVIATISNTPNVNEC